MGIGIGTLVAGLFGMNVSLIVVHNLPQMTQTSPITPFTVEKFFRSK